ncbi:MAG: hypothetical protein KKA90_04715 [Nanoarchaeota archaeon]|nr:hypothetical protein [Nanoarchaeota archaeon]
MEWFLSFLVAFAVAIILTPIFIRKLREAGFVGHDVHKADRPSVPEMGGIPLAFGFIAGAFVSIPFITNQLIFLLGGILTILLAAFIGVCDDLFGIRQKTKAFLPAFAAIPLMALSAGEHFLVLPFFGLIDFGIFFPLILIPLGITGAANAYNMLAGYNGLEVGLGVIASFFLGVIGLVTGRPEVAVLMFALTGASLGLLRYNRYPARIFIGDVGTFTIGAAIATAAIIGNLETFAVLVLGPQILSGAITVAEIIRRKPIQKFATIENGKLVPPERTYVQTLYFLIQRITPLSEKQIVWVLWGIGILFGLLGLALAFEPFGIFFATTGF